MRRLLLPGLLSLGLSLSMGLAGPARAQSLPVLSQNPPGLRWQQVSTPHFRVIYAAGLDSAARRTAARLERLHSADVATLGVRPRPISVVMQGQTTVPNGFVTFLPRHAEFFITPEQGQGLGTLDWLDGLVVHEFRHVGQFEKARQGVGRVLGPLLGDGALGVAAVGVPQWFFEGDAVGTETALTRSGRGRIPYFSVGLRANLLSGVRYSYQKAVNGSLRDNVPDWYVLGYFMTSYLKAHHGPDIWSKVLDRYYRFPFYPFSFSNGIRRTTGLTVEQLYGRTMTELDSAWRQQQPRQPLTTGGRDLRQAASGKVFAQYRYPQYVDDNTVLALKTGLDYIPQWVLLSLDGAERQVFVPGQLNLPEMLSVGGGKAVWPEFQQDFRWGQRIASELKVLDLKTGRLTRLGRGQRYSAAALSPDGSRLVATGTDASYHHALVILDAQTGAVQQTLPNPHNHFYQQPRWMPDGRRLVTVTLSPAGKTLQVIDPATGTIQNLLPWASVNLANPQPWGHYVLYNSPQMQTFFPESRGEDVWEIPSKPGVDNIYAVALPGGRTYQVTNRPFGAYHAAVSPDGRTLAFHDYRATGARVMQVPLDTAQWTSVYSGRLPIDTPDPYATKLAAGEPNGRQIARLLTQPDSAAPPLGVRRYRPLAHAFNLFSYGVVQSPAGSSVAVGLRSQDLLNTTQVFAGVGYDQTERTFNLTGAVSYQGLYPVFDADITYGGRDAAVLYQGQVLRDQWQYARASAGVRLPLNLTRSKYLEALTVSAYLLHEQVYGYNLPVRLKYTEPGAGQPVDAVQGSLGYAFQRRASARGVGPRSGFAVLATGRTTPFGRGLQARQFGGQGSVYLPGLGAHDAIRLRAGYQWQDQVQYQFAPTINIPRGEGYTSFDQLAVLSADYNLPLAFTHWEVGRLLYVQRLRATLFGDVAQGTDLHGQAARYTYRNAGADLLVLFNVLRLRTPLEGGVRVTYRGAVGQWLVEPLAFSLRL